MSCRLSSFRFGGRLPPCLCAALLCLFGCDALPDWLAGSGDPGENIVALLSGATGSFGNVDESDSGGGFENAQPVNLPEYGKLSVHGALTGGGDIDIYRFGPTRAGEVLVVEVNNTSADTRAAVFDEHYGIVVANDDRNYYAGQRDPRIQNTLRSDHDVIYVAVAGKGNSIGLFGNPVGGTDYDMIVTRAAGLSKPQPRPQPVWVELGGGQGVRIAGEPPQDVPPFNVEAISPRYAGDREKILDLMYEELTADYVEYNVEFRRSDRDAPYTEPYSILYVGGFNSNYLGLADNVDWYNGEAVQEAIVYSETLRLFDSLFASPEQIARALGNVAAHELGHLLGLDHTLDSTSVMSEAASAQSIMQLDAGLIAAQLNARVFPIGMQDAPFKLALGVGLRDPFASLDEFLALKAAERDRRADEAATYSLNVESTEALTGEGAAGGNISGDLTLKSLGLRMCSDR